jgi:hypothetical protein
MVKHFKHCQRQRLKIFDAIVDSAYNFLTPSPTARIIFLQPMSELKSTKWRFSSLNHPNFEYFGLVPKSPTHTGLICVKTREPNISSLGPSKDSEKGKRSCNSACIG